MELYISSNLVENEKILNFWLLGGNTEHCKFSRFSLSVSLSLPFFYFLGYQTTLRGWLARPLFSLKRRAIGLGFLGKITVLMCLMQTFMGIYVSISHSRLKSLKCTLIDLYLASF